MKYVIYGAGYRGIRFFNYIGTDNVAAFMDSDINKQGKECCGKRIISLEEYKKEYMPCFIIITPVCHNDIKEFLEQQNIYQYNDLSDLPSEFSGYGDCGFESSYEEILHNNNDTLCCYGINVLSFLFYDYLYDTKKIFICPEKNVNPKKVEWIKMYHSEIKIKEHSEIKDEEIILMSVVGENEKKFSNKSINLFEYASNNKKYFNAKLQKLKNSHLNKKCFIAATGPSLCIEDLNVLKENDIFCFGVNGIIQIKNEWIADAYIAVDSHFISSNIQNIKDYKCKYKFIGDSCQEFWEKEKDGFYKVHVTKAGTEAVDFSENICQKVYGGYGGSGTVTYVAIQFAVYMGFTEIYLLGVDCNYVKGSKNNYFIKGEDTDNMDHKENFMIKAYEYAKQYADAHGIKIYNATRGGMLEVFERVDFNGLF